MVFEDGTASHPFTQSCLLDAEQRRHASTMTRTCLSLFIAEAAAMFSRLAMAAPIPDTVTTFTTVQSFATPAWAGRTVPRSKYEEPIRLVDPLGDYQTAFTTLSLTGGQVVPTRIAAPVLTWTVAVDENGSTAIVAETTTLPAVVT